VCLDLSENKLETIPDSIGELLNLTDLTLSSNCLEVLPDSIGKTFYLSFIHLIRSQIFYLNVFVLHSRSSITSLCLIRPTSELFLDFLLQRTMTLSLNLLVA